MDETNERELEGVELLRLIQVLTAKDQVTIIHDINLVREFMVNWWNCDNTQGTGRGFTLTEAIKESGIL